MGRAKVPVAPKLVAPPKLKDPDKLNLADGTALKRALDECVVKVLAKAGYPEDHFVTDVKLALGFLTCAIAGLAQFYPKKYPANWGLLMGCVAAYALCTGALNLFTHLYEGDAFLITKPKKGSQPGSELRVSSKLPRFGTEYTLVISSKDKLAASESVKLEKSVGQLFHADGYLADGILQANVMELLRSYEAKLKKTN